MHDVRLVAIDKELEGMTHDEDEDDSDQNSSHVKVPAKQMKQIHANETSMFQRSVFSLPPLLGGHLLELLGAAANGAIDPRVEDYQHEERDDPGEEEHGDHGDLD